MADNKDDLVTLIRGLAYVTDAGYEPVPPPYDEKYPAGSLSFFASFTRPDSTSQFAKRFIAESSYSDPTRNIDNVFCFEWLIGQLRGNVPIDQIEAETPPAPPSPVTDTGG